MRNIIIRHATSTDDFLEIAKCLYLTDPYIYPTAFGSDIDKASSAITKLINREECLFNYKSIYIATMEGKICGVLLYNEYGSCWDTDIYYNLIKEYISDKERFVYAANNYFIDCSKKPKYGYIDIVALCVLPEYRRMSVSSSLLKTFIEEKSGNTLTLDVLADNSTAIHTYKKFGFSITNNYKGFGFTEETRPDCYHMVREI